MPQDNRLAPVGQEIGKNVNAVERGELCAKVDYVGLIISLILYIII